MSRPEQGPSVHLEYGNDAPYAIEAREQGQYAVRSTIGYVTGQRVFWYILLALVCVLVVYLLISLGINWNSITGGGGGGDTPVETCRVVNGQPNGECQCCLPILNPVEGALYWDCNRNCSTVLGGGQPQSESTCLAAGTTAVQCVMSG